MRRKTFPNVCACLCDALRIGVTVQHCCRRTSHKALKACAEPLPIWSYHMHIFPLPSSSNAVQHPQRQRPNLLLTLSRNEFHQDPNTLLYPSWSPSSSRDHSLGFICDSHQGPRSSTFEPITRTEPSSLCSGHRRSHSCWRFRRVHASMDRILTRILRDSHRRCCPVRQSCRGRGKLSRLGARDCRS